MTCIIGLVDNGTIYMGGDSVVTYGSGLWTSDQPKVVRNGSFLFGGAGSPRAAQLLEHVFVPPPRLEGQGTMQYMATAFTGSIRECFEADNFKTNQTYKSEDRSVDAGPLVDTEILMGYEEQLYIIDSCCNIIHVAAPYRAIGAGQDVAIGALYALTLQDCDPEYAVRTALEAANAHISGIRPPYLVINDDDDLLESQKPTCLIVMNLAMARLAAVDAHSRMDVERRYADHLRNCLSCSMFLERLEMSLNDCTDTEDANETVLNADTDIV